MTTKICIQCKGILDESDEFCGSCGEKYTKPKAIEPPIQSRGLYEPVLKNEPFAWRRLIKILFNESEYSVERAKWFYRATEKIFNVVMIIAAIIGGGYLLIQTLMFISAPGLLLLQLYNFALGIAAFIGWIIFVKLLLTGIGSVIHIAEMAEKINSKNS